MEPDPKPDPELEFKPQGKQSIGQNYSIIIDGQKNLLKRKFHSKKTYAI